MADGNPTLVQAAAPADSSGNLMPSAYARNAKSAGLDIITWSLERSGILADGNNGSYYQTYDAAIKREGDMFRMLDVLAQDIGVIGVFSDWPATVIAVNVGGGIIPTVLSIFLLARAAEAKLRAAQGSIVTIASTRAHMSEPNTEAYSASKGGVVDAEVLAKWAANAPLAFVDQYAANLKQYKAISMDVGDQDGLKAGAQKLHEVMDQYGIANAFEIYSGTHTSAVAVRFQNFVMPFFSRNLCAGKNCK